MNTEHTKVTRKIKAFDDPFSSCKLEITVSIEGTGSQRMGKDWKHISKAIRAAMQITHLTMKKSEYVAKLFYALYGAADGPIADIQFSDPYDSTCSVTINETTVAATVDKIFPHTQPTGPHKG